MINIKSSLLLRLPISDYSVKTFKVPSTAATKMAVFEEKVLNINICLCNPQKGISLSASASFDIFSAKNMSKGLVCKEVEKPPPPKN